METQLIQLNTSDYFRLDYQKYTIQDFFKEDGAPAHRSSSTSRFLDEKRIRTLEKWPAQSPNINIIENVCQILKTKVYASVEIMWRFVQEEWNSFFL